MAFPIHDHHGLHLPALEIPAEIIKGNPTISLLSLITIV